MDDGFKTISETAEYIDKKLTEKPEIGIVLGSGSGMLTDAIEDAAEIDYRDIPNFPVTTVEGHTGVLISGRLGGKRVLVMKGRFHYYEGYDIGQVVFGIRVFKLLGINCMLLTNAAGGISNDLRQGDLMIIRDHIGLFAPSPLRGKNLNEFGVRFPDMNEVYNGKLRKIAKKAATELDIDIKEGVYAYVQGPMYETPAEIKALRVLGADAVGMSTVPEAITAHHAGMRVLGISCITNMAAGISDKPPSHLEVIKTVKEAGDRFVSLVKKILEGYSDD